MDKDYSVKRLNVVCRQLGVDYICITADTQKDMLFLNKIYNKNFGFVENRINFIGCNRYGDSIFLNNCIKKKKYYPYKDTITDEYGMYKLFIINSSDFINGISIDTI